MNDKTVLLMVWVGLLLCSWPLDRLVEHYVIKLPPKSLLRATDTVVHGLIGGVSYLMACIISPKLLIDPFILLPYFELSFRRNREEASKEFVVHNAFFSFCVAFMISSCIDLDHIVKTAIQYTNQAQSPVVFWKRGYLHLSLPPLVLSCILYLSSFLFLSCSCVIFATLSILSVLSHHIRDGLHHGLDFYPLGTTSLLPYWVYLTLTLILPIITSHISLAVIHFIKSSLEQPVQNINLV